MKQVQVAHATDGRQRQLCSNNIRSMAGYSVNPLSKKLGLKEGQTVKLINPPLNYAVMIGDVVDRLIVDNEAERELDFIHLFTNSWSELEEALPTLKAQIKRSGSIWVSWYKKSAKMATELSEDLIREHALAAGLVDVKVCAVDEQWSALKLVFRLTDR